jgi:prepilin-type N-terminal cleavage/methylation domain-containing protein
MRRPEHGLTLLEVMAAVALLGILYTYLAQAAIQGVHTAGQSRQRMEASLLVDEELARLETGLATGVALPDGVHEDEREDFVVVTEVTPFPLPESITLPVPVPGSPTAGDRPSLFGGRDANDPGLVRRIQIRVLWQDGIFERSVERTTFGYDKEATEALLERLEAGNP